MNEVLIIIPAFNEEASIGPLLEKLAAPEISAVADVLVVNDASADMTGIISRQHNVAMVSHIFNLGYGSALQLGYKYAVRKKYKFVIQIDADGQHDVSNVLKLYERLNQMDGNGRKPDIVIGSRFLSGSDSFPISGVKKLGIRFFRWTIKRAVNKTVTDPTSGLQGLSRRAFSYYSLFQNYDYRYPDANMIIQMLLLGYDVVEIPACMHERKAGASMHSGIIKPLIYMMIMPLSIFSVFCRAKLGLQKPRSFDQYENIAYVGGAAAKLP